MTKDGGHMPPLDPPLHYPRNNVFYLIPETKKPYLKTSFSGASENFKYLMPLM